MRLERMPTLASPLAFELCDGTCGDPQPSADNKNVSCAPNDNCKGSCYCQVFHRRKGSPDSEPWRAAPMDKNKLSIYRPDKQEYKCFCVKPILESETTIDSVTYTTRYVLCSRAGSCGLEMPEVIDSPGHKHTEVKCSGTCTDTDCKCTLFKLQVGGPGFDVSKAKWELAGKTDKQIRYEEHMLYRCFCLK
jgi:hypothetical protein